MKSEPIITFCGVLFATLVAFAILYWFMQIVTSKQSTSNNIMTVRNLWQSGGMKWALYVAVPLSALYAYGTKPALTMSGIVLVVELLIKMIQAKKYNNSLNDE